MYTLLSRYSDIMKRDPRINHLVKMERHATNELPRSNQGIRSWLEKSKVANGFLKILAVFGVSLIMADGILTPAQSVLGAIQGIEVVKPDITSGTIVGASCAIIVVLYVVQPFGIHKLSSAFAPIVVIWLLGNGVFGIYNLAVHDWTVLKAFSPYFAGEWFVRNGTTGWLVCATKFIVIDADTHLGSILVASCWHSPVWKPSSPIWELSAAVQCRSRGFSLPIHASCSHTSGRRLSYQMIRRHTRIPSSRACPLECSTLHW